MKNFELEIADRLQNDIASDRQNDVIKMVGVVRDHFCLGFDGVDCFNQVHVIVINDEKIHCGPDFYSRPTSRGYVWIDVDIDSGDDVSLAYRAGHELMRVCFLAAHDFMDGYVLSAAEYDICVAAGLLSVDAVFGLSRLADAMVLDDVVRHPYGKSVAEHIGYSWRLLCREAFGAG